MLPKFPKRVPPKQPSGNIHGHTYDPEAQTLDVIFDGGRTYRYSGVGMDKAAHFRDTDSQGSFLHQYIIPHHKAQKL